MARVHPVPHGRPAKGAGSLVGLVLVVIGLLALWGLRRVFRNLGIENVADALLHAGVVVLMAWQFWHRRRRGEVLVDGGPHPAWAGFTFGALLVAAVLLHALLKPDSGASGFSPIGLVTILIVMVCCAVARAEFTERGLWLYWALIPWTQLRVQGWRDGCTLDLEIRGWFTTTASVVVRAGQSAELERILAERQLTASRVVAG